MSSFKKQFQQWISLFLVLSLALPLQVLAAADYGNSSGYFRNLSVTDIGTSGPYVNVSTSYSLDGETISALVLVRNTGDATSAGNVVVKRQAGYNLTYINSTLQKRCTGVDLAYVDIDASWTNFNNGTGYDFGSMLSGRTCAIKYSLTLGATGNTFASTSQDIVTVYDNGTLKKTVPMTLYSPFVNLKSAKNLGTSSDELILQLAETPYIDATSPTTDSASARNLDNFEVKVGSGSFTAFAGTVAYNATDKELTLTSSSNLFATGDSVQLKIKNLKTDYGRFLNSANYAVSSVAGITTNTQTATDNIAPYITEALYESSISRVDIVFSESMLTGIASGDITVSAGDFNSPTLSWPTVTGYSAGQVLRLTLGGSASVTAGTTKVYFSSNAKDLANNVVTNIDLANAFTLSAGSLSAPVVTSFSVSDQSTTSVTAYTNAQTIRVAALTASGTGSGLVYKINESTTPPAVGTFGALPTTYTLSSLTDGQSYTLYPWVKDSNGMSILANADSYKATITVDTSGPTFSVTDDANASWNTSDTITVSASDAGAGGVTGVTYAFSDDATCGNGDDAGYSSLASTVTVNSTNTSYVCFRADDALGNRAYSSAIGPLKVDPVAPSLSISDNASATWMNSDMISVNTSDATSGLAETKYLVRSTATCDASLDATFTSSGVAGTSVTANSSSFYDQYICFRSVDNTGNKSYAVSSQITKLDVTAPTTVTCSTTPSFTAVSGVITYTEPVDITCTTTDAAPTSTATIYYTESTDLNVAPADPTCSSGTWSNQTSFSAGDRYWKFIACDGVGNTSAISSYKFEKNTTGPSFSVQQFDTDTAANYYSSEATNNLTLLRDTSGSNVASECKWRSDATITSVNYGTATACTRSGNEFDCNFGAMTEGTHTRYVACTDTFSNITALTVANLTVDRTAPTITSVTSSTADGTYGSGSSINVTVNFSENVTSTGSVTVTLETGTTDRTCSFTVSNASSTSCTYTVQTGDASSDLTVNSVSGTIADLTANAMTNFTPVTNLASSSAIIISAPASSGGGGGGGGGGASGPDTTTVFSLPSSPSDKEVVLPRPIKAPDGEFTRPVIIEEYYTKSSFSIPYETKVTDLSNTPYTGIIYPVSRTSSEKFTSVSLPQQSLVYASIYTVAGDKLLYSKPISNKIVLNASLRSYTEKNKNFEILYWVPSKRLASISSLIAATDTPEMEGEWRRLGGSEMVKDGVVEFTTTHSTYLAFVKASGSNIGGGGETPVTPTEEATVLQNLTDIANHWSKDFVVKLYTMGVVKGKGDTKKFFPDESIDRAAFLKMMIELFGYDIGDAANLENPFADINSSDWYAPYVLKAYHEGIVKGYAQKADQIPLVQPAQMNASSDNVRNIQRILNEMGLLSAEASGYYGEVTSEAVMQYQKSRGIMMTGTVGPQTADALNHESVVTQSGKEIMLFKPAQNINRAEALKIIFLAAKTNIPAGGTTSFTDVPKGAWFESFVAYARSKDIVKGKSETTFAPGDNITRAEAAKIALKVYESQ